MRMSTLAKPFKLARFFADLRAYAREAAASGTPGPSLRNLRAMLDDATVATGFDTHYVYHSSWAARLLAETRPNLHIDVS